MSSRAKTPAQIRRGYAAHCRRYERAIRRPRLEAIWYWRRLCSKIRYRDWRY